MHRTLYVLVYPSRLFAAHWSFWIPYLDDHDHDHGQESDVGDRIHVTGDRLKGFQYEYVKCYNVREDERKPNAFAVGLLSAASLSEESADGDAFNAFDGKCREVQAPGPSLNNVASMDILRATGPPLMRRIKVEDCQFWIKQAVAHLVGSNMLLALAGEPSKRTPREIVEGLPRH